ncbi:putative tRNA pseudouridine synthase [Talaromyces proteolyticus]|uniref:tRNA pseudouridine synthase 1 n=1 Tax=Talaromyces proteolyticus TaxID=1131652 RepID=A0AAD4KNF0_9EURO|nr:putative tRNA pseudouridine synthase [Talaromyces proteolyticus]KAH8696009.1 putative tRNA pseudouridine synthase [Talaromyces proteolyticus]
MAGRGGFKNKKRNMGRKDYNRQSKDRRAQNQEEQAKKKRKIDDGDSLPIYATQFSADDIAAEERRPKKKVAVLIGYSGTGYHGMQLTDKDKTIEGDLFAAFVAAGAISKANAIDPKKSSLVRCARTDKGVHAAGNIVSLKLIVEDPDIVQKINEHLSPQIRVWGYEIVTKSFSCYYLCDSRIYEYLIPTHCFLPPHPGSYLGKKVVELAEKHGESEAYRTRQSEVLNFWQDIDEKIVNPILADVPEEVRSLVLKALYSEDEQAAGVDQKADSVSQNATAETEPSAQTQDSLENPADGIDPKTPKPKLTAEQKTKINEAIKAIKATYINTKRAYRIPKSRLQQVQEALDKYIGTHSFHNYTIQKDYKDPSAKRVIKSFIANPEPIVINGTEWLSLKVHGQSFMMHQIRKMVAMAALVVRCGCDPKIIEESYGSTRLSIPKAPGLGLLLERPIFDTYNRKGAQEFGKEKIDFGKFEKEMNEFKQREIYDRIYREEDESNQFGHFFSHIDHFPVETFLYLTSGGIAASQQVSAQTSARDKKTQEVLAAVDSDSDVDVQGEEGG